MEKADEIKMVLVELKTDQERKKFAPEGEQVPLEVVSYQRLKSRRGLHVSTYGLLSKPHPTLKKPTMTAIIYATRQPTDNVQKTSQ